MPCSYFRTTTLCVAFPPASLYTWCCGSVTCTASISGLMRFLLQGPNGVGCA